MSGTPFRRVLFGLGIRREDGVIQAPDNRVTQPPSPKLSGTYAVTKENGDPDPQVTYLLDDDPDELTPARIVCQACKGRVFFHKESADGRSYVKVQCKWCTGGSMSGTQVNDYLNRNKEIEDLCRYYVAGK